MNYHIERNDVLKRDFACFVFFDQEPIDREWTASCGKTKNERSRFSGDKRIDSVCGGAFSHIEILGRETLDLPTIY